MKIVDAIGRYIYRPEPPTLVPSAPFDDGLIEIARLIASDDEVEVPSVEVD